MLEEEEKVELTQNKRLLDGLQQSNGVGVMFIFKCLHY